MIFYTVIDNEKIYLEGSYKPTVKDVLVINGIEYIIEAKVLQVKFLNRVKRMDNGYYHVDMGSEIYLKVKKC